MSTEDKGSPSRVRADSVMDMDVNLSMAQFDTVEGISGLSVQTNIATPFYPYHVEKAIAQADVHHLASQGVFYPQTQHDDRERMQQQQQQSAVGDMSEEFHEIYADLRKIVKMRQRYLRLSVQRPGDDPKDLPSYQPYPVHSPHYPNTAIRPSFGQSFLDVGQSMAELTVEDPDIDVAKIPGKFGSVCYKLNPDGVYQVYESAEKLKADQPRFEVPSLKEYFQDLDFILGVTSDGPTKSLAYRRLKYLESRFQLYLLLNEHQELSECKRVPHRDFYNVRKVDTHVHHSACMNQKHLLRFIKSKLKRRPNDTVIFRDHKYLTLQQVFESLNLTAYDLSIDTLDMHAHKDSFHRFDKFNLKYNPIGESRLREIFLKTDNLIQGKYLAELTHEVISELEASKYQMAEYRISIYGRSPNEWDKVAAWVCSNGLFSSNVRWLIQVPRLYSNYKKTNTMETFEELIVNVFKPLFEVTMDPHSHPQLHVFLQRVVGFDSVDDESKAERRIHRKYPVPRLWDLALNPPYAYYIYYLYANLASLNQLRQLRGFNTFTLRPHAGEAGDTDHLTAAFLTSYGINHGILLRKVPALQYLFYLEQVGIAMSPLSNNALFINYERNPFPTFFKLGMNVSLSTDDPLQFHFTREPLIEEYSVAAQIFKLSSVDMCELARNSVLQSGWELASKQHWLGERCYLPGPAGNDIHKTNVPDLRIQYRYQTLLEERNLVLHYDEPEVYDYPGWPFVIPVAGTDVGGTAPLIVTKIPSITNQALLSPRQSPQVLLRRHGQPSPSKTRNVSPLVAPLVDVPRSSAATAIDDEDAGKSDESSEGSVYRRTQAVTSLDTLPSPKSADSASSSSPSLLQLGEAELAHPQPLGRQTPILSMSVQPLYQALSRSAPTTPSPEDSQTKQSASAEPQHAAFGLDMPDLSGKQLRVAPGVVMTGTGHRRRTRSLEHPSPLADNNNPLNKSLPEVVPKGKEVDTGDAVDEISAAVAATKIDTKLDTKIDTKLDTKIDPGQAQKQKFKLQMTSL